MIVAAVGEFFRQLLHPGGSGYWFWSGIGSDVTEIAILGGIVALYRRHKCHVRRCWRMSWHPHPDHGHPVCRRHHPDGRGV